MTDDTAFDRERIAKLKERAHKASSRTGIGYRTAWLQYHSALQAAFERGTLVFVASPKPDDDLADRLRMDALFIRINHLKHPIADNLCEAAAALDQIAALTAERDGLALGAQWARNRLDLIADESWHGDGRDLKRSIIGIFADFDEALSEPAKSAMKQMDALTAENERLRNAPPNVKPLVWTDVGPSAWKASDPTGGVYEVVDLTMGRSCCHHLLQNYGRQIGDLGQSPDAAKATAQADYEARILSALEPPTAYLAALDQIAALTAQLAEARATITESGWQPIETAPSARDNVDVLVWGPHLARVEFRLADGDWWRAPGTPKPTHWRPIPKGPSE